MATPALFLEYEEVLGRAEHRAVHGMSTARIKDFLIGLAGIIEPIRIYYFWRPQMRDVDEMVFEAALNGSADAIVTHNVKDFVAAASRFNLRVVNPARLLKEMLK